MLYTGGTTGMPKGVMYPQGDITERLVAALPALRAMPSVPALEKTSPVSSRR